MSPQIPEQILQVSAQIKSSIAKVVVGQQGAVEDLIVAMWTGGHVLIEGLPGLAKTTLVQTMAQVTGLDFQRVQFTPDLMPADILGMEILDDENSARLRFVKGPVFAQILLADEINRTPPKTQAALLQAMQEGVVSIGGVSYDLPYPFVVFATQNPIENEGTYPLPEAQLDRFSLKVVMDYPSYEEELIVATMGDNKPTLAPIESPVDWRACSDYIDEMPVTQSVIEMAVRLVRCSRPECSDADDMVRENVRWGAGPRASQALIRVAKVKAAIDGRSTPTPDDIRSAALPVLRHRMMPTFAAEAKHISSEAIIHHILSTLG